MDYRHWKVAFLISLFSGSSFLYATSQAVTQISTYTQPSTQTGYIGTDSQSYNWGTGSEVVLDTFTAGGNIYSPSHVADNVIVRRVDNDAVTGTKCALFAERDSTNDYDLLPSLECDLAKVMAGRVINRGWLDVFSNEPRNNIERVDFVFTNGLIAPSTVSDLGNTGFITTEKSGNNPTVMAVITAIDASGNPTDYAPLVKVWPVGSGQAIMYGMTGNSFNFSFLQDGSTLATQNGEPIQVGRSTEDMGVAFVTLDDLGIEENQTIYGFSYFSQDIYDDTQLPSRVASGIDPVDFMTFSTDTSGAGDVADADMYGGVAGYFSLVKNISGKAYEDTNSDSTQNSGEANVANISVDLYADTNANGVLDNGETKVASSETNASGEYSFNVGSNANYLIVIDTNDSDLTVGSILGSSVQSVSITNVDINSIDFRFSSLDTDGDTIPNSIDLDDDNDGILDNVENPCNSTYNFDVSSEGWYTINDNNNTLVGSNPASHSTDPVTGNVGCTINIDGLANANIAGASPTHTNYIVDADPNGGLFYLRSPSYGGADYSAMLGGTFKYDHYNYRVGYTGDPSWLTGSSANGIVNIYGTNGQSITAIHTVNFTNFENGIWNSHSLLLDETTWSGTLAEIESVLASVDYISIKMEFIGGGNTGDCTDVEYYALDNIIFEAPTATCNSDFDNDGISNDLDLDSDNDGIPDNVEAQTTAGYVAPTSVDGTGTFANYTPVDTDNDGLADYLDTDSDNDNISDISESGLILLGADNNNDGIDDGVNASYSDVNGIVNSPSLDLKEADNNSTDVDYRSLYVNNPPVAIDFNNTIDIADTQVLNLLALITDTDIGATLSIFSINDVNLTGGVQSILVPNGEIRIDASDVITFVPNSGFTGITSFEYVGTDGTEIVVANVNITVTSDRDGDGVIDSIDLDDDNDGILDSVEGNSTVDTDNDTIPNYLDLDSDNDGIPDNVEAQTTAGYIAPIGDINTTTGVYDVYGAGLIPVDTDEDNITDMLDSDSDNDNISDCLENNSAIASCEVNASDVGTNGLVSWAESANDYNDTNGLAYDTVNGVFTLDDSDNDVLADGSDANGTVINLDYRDNVTFIDAVDDNFSVNGFVGGVLGDVTLNDTFNTVALIDTDMNISIVNDSDTDLAGVSIAVDGTLSMPSGVEAGSYNVKYQICEALNPSNCDEANVTVDVTSAVMAGSDDSNSSVTSNGGEVIANVTANDTLNGANFTLGTDANITGVTSTTPFLDINLTNGTATVPSNTPAGTYTEEYTVCENLNPTNCVTQEVSVTVEGGSLVGIADTNNSVNGTVGGVVILNVISNDVLDGNPALLGSDVNITAVTDTTANLEINPLTGEVSVIANTPVGTYTEMYTVCEILNPSNCADVNVSVTVLLDSDKDGILDSDDLDDDNDGIPDTVEENGTPNLDTDGDGIPDRLDLDSDNDGILDLLESGQNPANVDSNNDGVLDSTTDVDNDGLMDSADRDDSNPNSTGMVTPIDTDGDNTPDFQDVDSDNDGLTDLIEVGIPFINDANNDGMIDTSTGIGTGVDENGVPLVIASVVTPLNTDGDSVPDYRDLDSDNDGLMDVEEAGGVDANEDGVIDTPNTFVDPTTVPDADNDGTLDPLEPNNDKLPVALDGNGDGIIDDITDTDGDGVPDVTDGSINGFGTSPALDSDNDGIADIYDLDDDNDGIPDAIEEDGNVDLDTDGDSVPDRLDLDSDNDGILDLLESGQDPAVVDTDNNGVLDSTTDADNDGLMESADADDNDGTSEGTVTPLNTDGDSNPDFQDVDSDNDSLSDMIEAGISADNDADDNDGMIDNPAVGANGIPTVVGFVTSPVNTDGDTVPDYRDLDSDNDGLNDVEEVDGLDENKDGIVDVDGNLIDASAIPDSDGDDIPDVLEVNNPNLPIVVDANEDGIIDDATDTDKDGIPDVMDREDSIFGTGVAIDSDGDGIANAHDIDDDNDGIPDTVENKGDASRDTDGDGVIDSLDLDSDNDGMLDILEAGGVDSNNDGRVDDITDTDRDGLADVVDVSKDTANNPVDENAGRLVTLLLVEDTDGDSTDNFQDVDSDNDGLSDLVEGGIPVINDEDDDGMIDTPAVDENGIPTITTAIANPFDSDNDGIPDYRELDSDNDGIKDIVEAGELDTDNNGLIDTEGSLILVTNLPDVDGDGIPNYREINRIPVTTVIPNKQGLVPDVVSDIEIGSPVTVSVLGNDDLSDFDISTLQITGTENPGDSLVVPNEGIWSITSSGEIIFTPEDGFEQDPTNISYSLENNEGERVGSTTVIVNYVPTVKEDLRVIDLSQPVTINVLENDNGDFDSTTVQIELPEGFMEEHPSSVLSEDGKSLSVPGEGTWTVNTDGSITYRIEVGSELVNPTPISYSVADTRGQRLETDAQIVLNQSVVADASDTEEVCEEYVENSISLYTNWSFFLVLLLGTLLGIFFFKEEKL